MAGILAYLHIARHVGIPGGDALLSRHCGRLSALILIRFLNKKIAQSIADMRHF
jgi:hypothetical protein